MKKLAAEIRGKVQDKGFFGRSTKSAFSRKRLIFASIFLEKLRALLHNFIQQKVENIKVFACQASRTKLQLLHGGG